MMKGITNAELREKLESIELEIKDIKHVKTDTSPISILLGIFTVFSIMSTFMMILDSNPLFFYFTILGISEMIFFILYLIYKKI